MDAINKFLTDHEHNILTFPWASRSYEFNTKDFTCIEVINAAQNTVKAYRFNPLDRLIAVKKVQLPRRHKEDVEHLRLLQKEMETLREASKSPNVVGFYGFGVTPYLEIWICMELMDLSLDDFYNMVHYANQMFPEEIL